jgi:hypothetical protein
MTTFRSSAAALLLLSFASGAALAAPAPLAEPAGASLTGFVHDDVGAALSGAEILVLASEPNTAAAVIHTLSSATGQFFVASIVPGVYRVAAIKPGYVAALGSVNTRLRSTVDLVLRPVPKDGQPGSEKVMDDMSWALRVPPRSILRDVKPTAVSQSNDTGGSRVASRMQDSVRGEVDHMVAMGSWRGGGAGSSSDLSGNETRMRLAGSLGERGAIQVHGRRGTLDSASDASTSPVTRGAADVDLDVSYDATVDDNVALRAFYSSGDFQVGDRLGTLRPGARQSQRSWGYDASWRKQVDASSHVALQLGFQDASLDAGQSVEGGWEGIPKEAENRAIGAQGSYENLAGEGHLVRVGVRAQRLSLQAPSARVGRDYGMMALDGATGWSLLLDTEDQWSVSVPFVVSYGLAVRQGFAGPDATSIAPRIGGTWTVGRTETNAEVSYVASLGPGGPAYGSGRSPYGYDLGWKARVDPVTTFRASASYVPSQADVWGDAALFRDADVMFVTDGYAADRFVALELERSAAPATVSLRFARGRAEGVMAPAWDDDFPVALLAERSVDYRAARVGVKAPRAGSAVALEYRALHDRTSTDELASFELDFSQDLVRFARGRASCRLLVMARRASGPESVAPDGELVDLRRMVAEHKRVAAGVALAF